MGEIRLKRAYEPPAREDGTRVLVDRLWPRGLSREHARIDVWPKEIAPSAELRRWFAHDPAKWPEFRERYRRELVQAPEALKAMRELVASNDRVTLVFAARDAGRNNAVALRELLEEG